MLEWIVGTLFIGLMCAIFIPLCVMIVKWEKEDRAWAKYMKAYDKYEKSGHVGRMPVPEDFGWTVNGVVKNKKKEKQKR